MNSRNLARKSDAKPLSNSEEVKNLVLGKEYELSLVLCGNSLSRKLNRIYRGKDKPTNVLAFPLTHTTGEIFINTEALGGFSALELYIHALLHLKGMEHSAKMESEEKRILKLINGSSHSSRHRHRHASSQGSNRRGISRRGRKNLS